MKIREAFSKETETEFLKKEQVLNPPHIRWLFLLFIILYAFFAVMDLRYYPDAWQTLFIVRFAIVIPLLISVILLSYKRSLSKFHQYYVAFSFFVGGAGIAYMLILKPEHIVYYGGLFLVYFSGYLLIRLRFYYATFSGLAILLFHFIGHIIINNELSETVSFGLLFYVGANLIGMVGAYKFEVKNREQFLHEREVIDKNNELMHQYKDKDEQFNKLEQSVKENIELIAKNKELDLLTKSLKESEERFSVLHNATFGGIALHDKGLILDCNQGLSTITGYSMDELIGMDGLLLIAPDYRDFVMSKIITGYEERYEAFGIRKNKEIYPLKLEARNLPYQGKQVRVVEFRDITDQREAENRLVHQNELMNFIIKHMNSGVAVHDKDLNYLYVSDLYKSQYNIDDAIIGKHHYDVFPDLPEKWRKVHQQSLQGKTVSADRDEYVHEDGRVDWTKWESRPWYNAQGDIGGIIIYTQVVNAYIEREEALKELNINLQQSEEQYRLLTTEMQLGLALHEIICDANGKPIDYRFISVNDSFEQLTGLKKEDILGKTLLEVMPNAEKHWIDTFGEVALSGKSIQYENYSIDLGKYYNTSAYSPKKGQFAVIVEDVTDRIKKEHELKQERKDLLISQGMAKLGTWRLDIKTNEVVWSEELYKMYGFDPAQPVPPYTEHMKLFTKTSWEKLSSALALTASEGIPYELVLETITQEGSNGWMWVRGEAEYDNQGKIVSIIGAAQDITQKKQKEDEIIYVSNHDYLTNIPNRRYFQEMLKRYDNEVFYPLGIIIMDMNGLKLINDAFGHSDGNEALKTCAETLNAAKREEDFLARIGGDEFAMICPNIDVEEMERLVFFIDKEITQKSLREIDLSLAIGYEIKRDKNKSIRTILTNAENYMYRNKVLTKHTSQNDMIQSILHTLTEKYNEEKIHSNRVSKYCKAIGEVLDLRKDEIIELELAGMVHDIGKISLPDAILKKPGKLTGKEWEVIRNHTMNGYQILRAADRYSSIAEYAMSHHERMDGKGYPNGIKGEEIPLFSRIISIADAYEAMTSDRPYRKAINKAEAIKELNKHSGTQFDAEIVNVFINKVLSSDNT